MAPGEESGNLAQQHQMEEEELAAEVADGQTSDEDMDAASEPEGAENERADKKRRLSGPEYPPAAAPEAAPIRKRLCSKRPPPAAYQIPPPPPPVGVLKRPGMLKKPAARKVARPSRLCQGYRGASCKFDQQHPGEPARAHPERGEHHCIFCCAEKMREAHEAPRQARFFLCVTSTAARFFHVAVIFPPKVRKTV